jgi:hypothetical protein
LELKSRHRLPQSVNGVILMADTCLMGSTPQAHVPAAQLKLPEPIVLYRNSGSLWCRFPGEFKVDGQSRFHRAPLGSQSNILADTFSFSLEPVGPRTSLA